MILLLTSSSKFDAGIIDTVCYLSRAIELLNVSSFKS